jgi:hypothetical protein
MKDKRKTLGNNPKGIQLRFKQALDLPSARSTVLFPKKVMRSNAILAQVLWDHPIADGDPQAD